MACLAKKASDRPQNIAQILRVLESLAQPNYLSLPKSLAAKSIPSKPLVSKLLTTVEQTCWQLLWPEDKPIQEIVFPQLLDTEQGYVPALSLMLSKQEIKNHALSSCYNQFIFIKSPHPMLLWVTVLYNRELTPKWLPCYLDMQNPQNHRLVSFLAKNELYPLIFFTLEAPHTCTNVLSSRIDTTHRQMLKTWVEQSQNLPPSSQPQLSKQLLKQQYKQMQSQMLQRLESKLQVVASSPI